jgi:hypothetical protein
MSTSEDINHYTNFGSTRLPLSQFNKNWRHNTAWSTPGGREIHHNNFSSMLGLLNLAVPHSLGLYHKHGTMIPCHNICNV